MLRRFTGWHMLAAMIGFFGVIIGVNVTMATFATRTFGGVVVKNSYVASQKFNGWLADARAQERLGWSTRVQVIDRRLVVIADAAGPLAGATMRATATHPLGRLPEVPLTFHEAEPGRYVANTRLPVGRWRLRLGVERGPDRAAFVEEVTA
ncbi:FixH family protein [Sphingosinithalassobacter sp. LHW66-3]|uniref:FixH family protein n=1 Tax=Sphingosinithalassobacter sp. LHW66-3 TaxID=3424718 RepID=UPI003D6A9779